MWKETFQRETDLFLSYESNVHFLRMWQENQRANLSRMEIMQLHLKPLTKVKIVGYSKEFNGKIGFVAARDGEYYKINMGGFFLYDLYLCELEEVN